MRQYYDALQSNSKVALCPHDDVPCNTCVHLVAVAYLFGRGEAMAQSFETIDKIIQKLGGFDGATSNIRGQGRKKEV